jgi:hypothetical protein
MYPPSTIQREVLLMRVLAVDPGTEQSGWVLWNSELQRIERFAIEANQAVRDVLRSLVPEADELVIEEFESFGMAVGKEVFRTVFWYGRFAERWEAASGRQAWLMPRRAVKIAHCGTSRGTDATVWQAIVDRFGPPGTSKQRGVLFGIKSHMRSALALAIAFADQREGREQRAEARTA